MLSIMNLRPYQHKLKSEILQAWQEGHTHVLGQLGCGGGKSVIAASLLREEPSASIFIAHRAELVSGESLALARNGVRHRVIGQPLLRRECTKLHLAADLKNHVDTAARVAVASVDTLINMDENDPWFKSVRLIITDECAHLIRTTKWNRAITMMPYARSVGLTATPIRADGKGLGAHADGIYTTMLLGPTNRELELLGCLVPHVIYAPSSDIDLSNVPITASGDYSPKLLSEASHKSHIVGDVVANYLKFAKGQSGLTFTTDVESATEMAAAYRSAGVPAEALSGKTPMELRNALFRKFRNGELLQICGCEVFGEGTDLPDCSVISLARPTESYGLFCQQVGRVKRINPTKGKTQGIVIDHVRNVERHCAVKRCPQTGESYIAIGERDWTLDRRERRTSSKTPLVAITTCVKCLRSYERVLGRTCPYCGDTTEPVGRSSPAMVDGVLSELDPSALAAIQREVSHVDGAATVPWGAPPAVQGAILKRHRERHEAQRTLRDTMALWGGWYGRTVEEAQRAFWLKYGVDVGTAQTLGRTEAETLTERLRGDLIDASVNIL